MAANVEFDVDQYRTWYAASYPVDLGSLRADRLDRLSEVAGSHGLDALLLVSGGAVAERANVRFAANYSTTGRLSCAIVTPDRQVLLVVSYSAHLHWARQTSWADDVILVDRFASGIAGALPSGATTIGIAAPPAHRAALERDLQAAQPSLAIADVGGEVARLLTRKSGLDLELVRLSGDIADRGMLAARESTGPGASEREIVAAMEQEVRQAGAEVINPLIGVDGAIAGPIPTTRKLRNGDTIQLSVELAGPGGFWVQCVRTFAIGEPPAATAAALRQAADLEAELANRLRIGATFADLEALSAEWHHDGLDVAVPIFHGVGLGMGEAPTSEGGLDWPVEEGMSIVLHPNLFGGSVGAFQGDTYETVLSGPPRRLTGRKLD